MAQAVIMATAIKLPKILENYDSFTTKLENYLSVQDDTAKKIQQYTKCLYDVTKKIEDADHQDGGDALAELITENFDEEQIWQQIELQNEARLKALVSDVASVVARKDRLSDLENVNESSTKKKEQVERTSADEELEDEEEGETLAGGSGSDGELDERLKRILNEVGSGNEEEEEEEDDDEIEERLKQALREEQMRNGQNEDESENDEFENDPFRDKPKKKKKPVKIKPSEVDDKFFKLSEMENFLDLADKDEDGNDSDEYVDLLKSMSSEEESDDAEEEEESGKNIVKYSDFFDVPHDEARSSGTRISHKEKERERRNDDEDDDENEDDDDDENDDDDEEDGERSDLKSGEFEEEEARNKLRRSLRDDSSDDDSDSDDGKKNKFKSSFETRQERLKAKIKHLEAELIQDKPWQLKGEITAKARPENALLEEDLEFDQMTREAPIITEKTSMRLEDIIKQRIKDKAWDDVERKVRPVETPSEFKKKLVLDQEKSKLSLAQIYEQEYLNKVAAAAPDAEEKPEEVPKEHKEITAMVNSLFRKLDALSNFHYTPKMITPEVQIITNVPAIQMEEVAPVSTSDATLLAPEEVKRKPRGEVIGKEERTDTDKNRERRKKKQRQRVHAREKEKREAAVAKLNPGMGNKYSKEKAIKDVERISKDTNVDLIDGTSRKVTKSSKAFFSQLQNEVKSQISQKTQAVKRSKPAHQLSAKRVKL